MKTSTKLFIILLVCIPISLVAYNAMLKQQLDARKLVLEYRPVPEQVYVEKKLPAYKHIVIDGRLQNADGDEMVSMAAWQPNINLTYSQKEQVPVNLRVMRRFKDVLQTRVSHDTLYISFYKKSGLNDDGYGWYDNGGMVQLSAAGLQSIKSTRVQLNVFGVSKVQALDVKVAGSGFANIYNQQIDKLNVSVSDSAQASIGAEVAGTLNYTLLNKSSITVNTNTAKHFIAGRIDTAASMHVYDKASTLHGILVK